jgi:acetyl esterase/lipase
VGFDPVPVAGKPPRPPKPLKPNKAAKLKNVVYGAAKGKKLMLDLYVPKKTPPGGRPLVIYIHGGGWQHGNRKAVEPHVKLFNKHGFAVATLDYRLSQHAKFPAQIRDCLAAVRYLKVHAARLHLNPKRFGVWGVSAGGHLAALVATASGEEKFNIGPHSSVSSEVEAAVLWFSPTDLVTMHAQMGSNPSKDHLSAKSPEGRLVGGPLNEEKYRKRAAAASPINYISPSSPPFLLMHGDKDTTIPFAQSANFHGVLKANNVESELVRVKDAGHGFKGPKGVTKKLVTRVVKFFQKHLKG